MSVKLLTEHYLEFLSLKGDCTCSCESTLVKMPHCWESHVAAQLCLRSCADPGISVRGGGGVQVSLTKKLSLFYRSQMLNFKEIYHFSRFQKGSNIFQGVQLIPGGGGGGRGSNCNCLFPIDTLQLVIFQGVRTPCPPPPSGSALDAHP